MLTVFLFIYKCVFGDIFSQLLFEGILSFWRVVLSTFLMFYIVYLYTLLLYLKFFVGFFLLVHFVYIFLLISITYFLIFVSIAQYFAQNEQQ